MKRIILSILTIIGVGLLFNILFIQKSYADHYVFVAILTTLLVILTFFNMTKKTKKTNARLK